MPMAIRQRRVSPIGATSNAPQMPAGINNGVYDAAQGFINQTTNAVIQIHNKAALSDMASERADFEGFVNQQKLEAAKFRAENEDTDIADGVTTYTQDWDNRYKAIQQKAGQLKWQDNKNDILNSLKVRSPAWDSEVQSYVISSRHDKARRKFTEFQDTVLNTDYTAEVMAENKLREKQTGLPQLSQREYKLQLIKQQAEILANSGAIQQDDVPVALSRADSVLAKVESDQIFNASYGYLVELANTDDNGQPLAKPDYNRALEKVNSPTFQRAMGFDADAISKLTNMIENQRIASERLSQKAIEQEKLAVDDIIIKSQDEFLASVNGTLDQINNSTILSVKDKEEQRKKVQDRMDAIAQGKVDPIDEFDPQAYNSFAIRISKNSKQVSDAEISNAVGKGINGGITIKQREALFELKKKYDGGDIIGNRLHSRYSGAITGLRTARVFSDKKIDNIKFAAEAQSILDSWAIKNPDATDEDYENFFNRLLDTSNYAAGWDRFWFGLSDKGKMAARRKNVETLGEELGGKEDLSSMSDAELLKRIKGD